MRWGAGTFMTSVAVGTAIGAAALTVGRGTLGAVGNGLSFAAELVRATAGSPSTAGDNSGEAARAAIQQRIGELRQRIARHLAEAGIQLSQPVELISDGQGGIAVAGSHPQQSAIEEALNSDVLLERDFHRLVEEYADHVELNGAGNMPQSLAIVIAQASPLGRC